MEQEKQFNERPDSCKISINAKGLYSGKNIYISPL